MRYKVSKKLATAALATGLAFPGVMATSAAPASAGSYDGIGTGAVDIMTEPTAAGCQARNLPSSCTWYGAGVVVPNQWSPNEVITAYHIVEQVPNDGTSIFIKIPGQSTVYGGYVQRTDPKDDLAVLWIYDRTKPWPTAAQTFTTADVLGGNTSPAVGTQINNAGDAGGKSYTSNTGLDNNYGQVDNITLQPPLNPLNYYDYEGNLASLYNLIETNASCLPGDSGGPMWDDDLGGFFTPYVLAGINDRYSADGKHCYAIQIQWAIWDMLNTKPN